MATCPHHFWQKQLKHKKSFCQQLFCHIFFSGCQQSKGIIFFHDENKNGIPI